MTTPNRGFHLPMSHLEGQGFIVPQQIYYAPPPGYIAQPTVTFEDRTTGLCGIPLDKALHQDFAGMLEPNSRPLSGSGKICIRILWPGYDTWSQHINVMDGVAANQPITKARLAHEVAKKIKDFHQDMSTVRSADQDVSWWLNRVPLNQLVLLELRNATKGTWQPVIIWRF